MLEFPPRANFTACCAEEHVRRCVIPFDAENLVSNISPLDRSIEIYVRVEHLAHALRAVPGIFEKRGDRAPAAAREAASVYPVHPEAGEEVPRLVKPRAAQHRQLDHTLRCHYWWRRRVDAMNQRTSRATL